MTFTEPSLNDALAEVLREKIARWTITSEQTDKIRGKSGLRPDLIVSSGGRTTVVIENEFAPAPSVEQEAAARLGLDLADSDETIRAVVALITPADLKHSRTTNEARERILKSEFRFALHTPGHRFPQSGFCTGDIDDLTWFLLHAGTPADALERAIAVLEDEVRAGIGLLAKMADINSALPKKFAEILKQDFVANSDKANGTAPSIRQAYGMISTILVNAMLYQQSLADFTPSVRSLAQQKGGKDFSQSGFLDEWDQVLKVNYFPIFDLARKLLLAIGHAQLATRLVKKLAEGAMRLTQHGVISAEDLSGVVFQRFIADRKFLAANYTRPESAALLAHLAIPEWNTPNQYRDFRAADFACGTGTLIHAAYRRLAVLQELAGGNPRKDHAHMMSTALTASDIVPSAAHLAASMLSSVYPDQVYEDTRVWVLEYGRVTKHAAKTWQDVRLGSLDLIARTQAGALHQTSPSQKLTGAGHKHTAMHANVAPASQHLVTMNPPYTKAGSDWDYSGVHVKQYRGLGTTETDQQLMGKRQARLFANTCANGYAGLGSNYVAVADRMLRADGTLAFVLPATIAGGESWEKTRRLLRQKYGDVVIVSIAAARERDRSFSADTDMAELLLVARKGRAGRVRFVCLRRAPDSPLVGYQIAKAVMCEVSADGNDLKVGEDGFGFVHDADWSTLRTWNMVGIRDVLVAQVAERLAGGRLELPRVPPCKIPMRAVQDLAEIGLHHRNVATGPTAPFRRKRLTRSPAYPVLWGHDAGRERCLVVEPDEELQVVSKRQGRADETWNMRSHAHFSAGTRLNSQQVTACFTPESCLGGSGWPTVRMESAQHEAAYVAWANTTLGMLLHWYFGSKQQSGRAMLTVSSYAHMPVLDVGKLGPEQLELGRSIVDDFARTPFRCMHEAEWDDARAELDRRVLVDLLGLPESIMEPLALVRQKWSEEPIVHGGKKRAEPTTAEVTTGDQELAKVAEPDPSLGPSDERKQ